MKKTYCNPTMKVVKIQTTQIMAGSVKDTSGAEGLGVGKNWSNGSANARGGRFSRWEEDDFEE